MRIHVCDICKKLDKKITEAGWYSEVKGMPELALDLCEEHRHHCSKMTIKERVKFIYTDLDGITLDEETLDRLSKRQ